MRNLVMNPNSDFWQEKTCQDKAVTEFYRFFIAIFYSKRSVLIFCPFFKDSERLYEVFQFYYHKSQLAFNCSKLTIETLDKVRSMFKVNNKDTKTTPFGVFIVNFEHVSHLALVFLLLTLNM